MSCVVIDTSVLTDIFLTTRDRRPDAKELWDYLIEKGLRIRVPMYAVFEFACALKNEQILSWPQKLHVWDEFAEDRPLWLEVVPMDQGFFEKYFSTELPHMRAGNLIFVAMAKVDGAILYNRR